MSNESRSSELLLVLRTLFGAIEQRRRNECSSQRRTRCAPSASLRRRTAMGIGYAPLKSGAQASRW